MALSPSSIGGINLLSEHEKREIYRRIIPPALLDRFSLSPYLADVQGHSLLNLVCAPGTTNVEFSLFHRYGFPDPVLYGHLTDTLTGQIHILLYILNDPESPRFDVDKTPEGLSMQFGTLRRNLDAERAAMEYGLAPGQIRRGLRMLPQAIEAFETFVRSLGHEVYFVEPLYYHNAIIFERYGFAYQIGRKLMERIQTGFSKGGDLRAQLDDSTPFRQRRAADSIRLRSWAIHDGILGEPFTNVTMYKKIGESAKVCTCADCAW